MSEQKPAIEPAPQEPSAETVQSASPLVVIARIMGLSDTATPDEVVAAVHQFRLNHSRICEDAAADVVMLRRELAEARRQA